MTDTSAPPALTLRQSVLRSVFRAYFRALHGVTIAGLENLPADGNAIYVVNHQSFLDGCFVAAFLPGPPIFAVDRHIAQRWWARPFLALVRTLPMDAENPAGAKAMIRAVRDGQRLVIFPEGRITVTGALMKIYEGAAIIADNADAVLIPVRIDGLQYSKFSRMPGKVRRRWFPPLSLDVLPPVAIDLAEDLKGPPRHRALGAFLQNLMRQSAFAAADVNKSLFTALLDTARRHGRHLPVIEDAARQPLSYRRLLLAAIILGRRLAAEAPAGGRLGIMLPNANGAVITFFALQAFGRVPAMLNFSAGAEAMLGACAAAGIDKILCSHAFIEQAKLQATIDTMARSVSFIWLEEVRAGLGFGQKLRGWVAALRPRLLPGAGVAPDAPAVILFTSGSEGAPKGVALSHQNILANIAQIAAVVDFNGADRVFNAMPMFHAFGLTAGTLLPLLSGVPEFLYPSPLHYRIVPELIYDTESTIAFGTDTFLTGWARAAHPYDFHTMRYIFSGAEKVRDETRRLYADRFGTRILEGYGATETSPVLALNTPMDSRPGAAGRLLPGMAYRLEPVEGITEGSRLLVRGPNVMLGYLRADAPSAIEAPPDGWYDTGDICEVDDEGFITILARAKRFAKIAGEMVSMPASEHLAAGLWPDAAHAVVAIPDTRKGEALVLLTTQKDAASPALLAEARAKDIPEISVPRQVRVVDALPLLGSGKIDYVAATKLVTDQRAAA